MYDAIVAVRRFNRFFTQFVGALDANFLGTEMTLAEARVLFEIANDEGRLASDYQGMLAMDAGFMSRVIARFETKGWVERGRSDQDGRRRPIVLSGAGRAAFEDIDSRQRMAVESILGRLDQTERDRLSATLATSQALLKGHHPAPFTIRTFRQGDMGLIVSRQAVLYHEGYGWNANIEVNESEVVAAFLKNFKSGREQCWVAEVDGRMAGSILITDEGNGLSRLRLLYVEPWTQGSGIGSALVSECLRFARNVGYERMTLWTHSNLEAARRIYAREGFKLVATEDHDTFGPMLTGETWELKL